MFGKQVCIWCFSFVCGFFCIFCAVYSAPAKRAFRSTQCESTTSRTTRSTRHSPPPSTPFPHAHRRRQLDSTCHLAIWQLVLRFGRVACACSNAKLIQYYFCFFSVFNSSFLPVCLCVCFPFFCNFLLAY